MPRKRKYSQRDGELRAFSTSYNQLTGESDRKGRPLAQVVYVHIQKDDKQGALDELARQLRSRESLSGALRDWLAYAIEHRAQFHSLDHALGLRPMPGDKRTPATKEELMRGVLIFRLQEPPKLEDRFSWNELADVLGHGSADSVREFYARISPDLVRDSFALKVPGNSTGISETEWDSYYSKHEPAIKAVIANRKKNKAGRRRRPGK